MLILLVRHGETAWNQERRYQGRTDVPLSERGRRMLQPVHLHPDVVYVSPLQRCTQTARILFPLAEQRPEPDLQEMNFGIFEGKTAAEMVDNSAYRAWVDGDCTGRCPGGENWEEFSARTCRAFARIMEEADGLLVVVAHGGTQMAILERYGRPERTRWDWKLPAGGSICLDGSSWPEQHVLHAMPAD